MPEPTEKKQGSTKFQPGQSGNPAGRPKGSRNKLADDFLKALSDDFTEHGQEAIETVRTDKPEVYMKVVASLLPKEFKISVDPLDELTDDELDRYVKQLAGLLSLEIRDGESPSEQAQTSPQQPAKNVPPIH